MAVGYSGRREARHCRSSGGVRLWAISRRSTRQIGPRITSKEHQKGSFGERACPGGDVFTGKLLEFGFDLKLQWFALGARRRWLFGSLPAYLFDVERNDVGLAQKGMVA
jgi:hypothetical protein